jgi:hypothetical protein
MPDGTVAAAPDVVALVFVLVGRARVDGRKPISIEWRQGEVW